MPTPMLIEVDAASVRSGDVDLLPPTTVRIPDGGTVVVRGWNGAGKSTLLRLLAGVLRPTSGTVRFRGREVDERRPEFRRAVAAMIGLPPTAPDLTIRDHVTLVATTWSDDVAEAAESAGRVLSELGLDRLGSRFPHELSSGQTQLFGLALVLVRPFELLLLDEPEQRLDQGHLERMIVALQARRSRGVALVVATHSEVLAGALSGSLLRLDEVP
ncbi:ABC-type multidrug transport system ATPase subunit [Microbacterium resistens]|uniref:ABC-type multidrug transport system ATPase subunit n=1 Tax=Microbacterium resistens TaxID=156977 RepID=A0ABU1SEZ3_9MICO|nr:ATP-binding cassette domain-containing protein [Microbacterium resistens]MDR6868183.1 ABC-type multidrug transport system ATPase subunit [Microbacterium resistens]